MRCESWFFPECAANRVFFQNVLSFMSSHQNLLPHMFFPRMCFQSDFFSQNVLLIMFIFPRMCCQPCFFPKMSC
jgi:hypothetical protein